ncbi:GNAT family N-acetyltransferase [Arthrobacter echini]|uniref:GNAT family N-acetyltransferase n=1 Tax=Arthrobacter echini TaxID=1529066 RepID=A0A4S5E660_9MICC|nr:GNAT family N-acetyltransferase [Arthrobacter echini]THJ66933.1 GNAT family N-acetyltransferase [Arthrobacter echini]
MDPITSVTTTRLALTPLSPGDLANVFEIFSDPRTWAHLPSGRHRRQEQSEALIAAGQRSWDESGAGPWAVRVGEAGGPGGLPPGAFIGIGGVTLTGSGLWNLGYRLTPATWGHGFATELAAAALSAAATADPTAPVMARVLSNNPASSAVAERAGLTLRWEGPARDAVAADVCRRIYADRAFTGAQIEWLIARA